MNKAHDHVRNLAYGNGRDERDIQELGHEAIKGVVTAGTVGVTASLMGGLLGGLK
jgi:hypothetical protein